MYTRKKFMQNIAAEKKNWKSILEQTVYFSYPQLKISNYLGEMAESFLEFCNEIGLKSVAGGMGMADDTDELNQLNALEVENAVIDWPYFVSAPFSLDDCKRSVEILNRTINHLFKFIFLLISIGRPIDSLTTRHNKLTGSQR